MLSYLLRSLLHLLAVVFGISLLVFVLNYLVGDPVGALLGPEATPAARASYRQQMGFDRPVLIQYLDFAQGALVGDFGNSYRIPRPARELVLERMPATLLLAVTGMGLAILLALPLGVLAAGRPRSPLDHLVTLLTVGGQALPTYWLGMMLIILFSVRLHWLPASGYGTPAHLLMPAFCLGVFTAPVATRLVRAGMLEALNMEYVRTARAKGLPGRTVVWRHALRNALIPVVTMLGLQFGQLLGGAIITETVFAWPGVAQLAVTAIISADFPLTQAAVIGLALLITLVNLATDLIVALLDPQVRFG